jgi:outer membrane lipoprotein SlyB
MKKPILTLCVLLSGFILTGCTTPNASSQEYAPGDLSAAAPTVPGIVLAKRPIFVQGHSELGGLIGTLAGAIGGSALGGGRGQSLTTLGGAVLGGVAGSMAHKKLTSQNAYEYVVKVERPQKYTDIQGTLNFNVRSGKTQDAVTVVQTEGNISVGERVFVVMSQKPRIVKDMSIPAR